MKPEYICNTVVNNWQKEPGGVRSDSYELLTLSPTGIERLDENPEEHKSFAGTAIIISTVFFWQIDKQWRFLKMITSRLPKTYAKKKLCQYPAILTSRLVNDAFLFHYRRQQKILIISIRQALRCIQQEKSNHVIFHCLMSWQHQRLFWRCTWVCMTSRPRQCVTFKWCWGCIVENPWYQIQTEMWQDQQFLVVG